MSPPQAAPRRRWSGRFADWLPLGILLGFIALFLVVLGDRIVPARQLDVVTVVTVRSDAVSGDASEAQAISGREVRREGVETRPIDPWETPMQFQASGWVEPDPLPIKATALVDGIVDTVHVLEGQTVEKGQLLAQLIDDDATLDLATARNELETLRGESEAHAAMEAVALAELATLEKEIAAAEAVRDEIADRVARFDRVPAGTVAEREAVQARLELATQSARIASMETKRTEFGAKITQIQAGCEAFTSRIMTAQTEVDRRQLALDRTRIVAPVDGVVLELFAVPGQKRMLGMDNPDSSTIAVLYQPGKLQARIDVPLAEAAQLAVGQKVRLRSSFLPGNTFRGVVTRILGQADLQRNTLQAKVRIEDPDPRLRPEMLCRAEFLAPVSDSQEETGKVAAASGATGRVALFVPESALVEGGGRSGVWRADETGKRLAFAPVTTTGEPREGFLRLIEGLKPGDRVVVDPPDNLEEGMRFRPRREDSES